MKTHSEKVNEYFTETINLILDKLKKAMPEGVDINVPGIDSLKLDWRKHGLSIPYANLPTQEAVNFVAFLVNLQSGRSRFARGVATVGGRTHIGLITKDQGFRVLNEPELIHRSTGFGDD